ncbi:flagellar basal body rod C-terminal domain-containing protein [Sediminicoccus sp. KRV36]|uniref:flagellar hook-associated protein FlgK n=1 Tax=Sediminicoccus sp. KRV36 TaxID=3133721 RepID=UPI00200E3037|nr:flagellar basal body rod C-terminal domain-containing protein [Sediminicoccus rosea]UPY36840.1 flagellar basal body protein [Sediminicoccus rosea]
MSLDLALGIAKSGLQATQRALANVSQNITNADTPGYTRKTGAAESRTAAGMPLGVRLGDARREVDQALLNERDARGGEAAAAGVRERLLSGIEAMHGSAAAGENLGDTIAALRTSLTGLRAAPGEGGLQRDAVNAARNVASRFQDVAGAVTDARQQAHDGMVREVALVNAGLRDIAQLTIGIRGDRSRGLGTSGLEDQRDQALAKLSESLPIHALHQADGGLVLLSKSGFALPLDPDGDAISASMADLGPSSFHGGGGDIPPILLGGTDITRQLGGGRLGEYVALRDTTLPRYLAELDLAAATLTTRFDQQGLRLFTGRFGEVPDATLPYNDSTSGQIGFALQIRVSDAVAGNPALMRDGTQAVAETSGGPSAFNPNPADGPAGFATLLDRILDHSLGETVREGVEWPPIASGGIGPDGSLNSPFIPPRSIGDYAATLTGLQTGDRAAASAARERAEGLRVGMDARFQRESGVDPDAEMAALIRLQNAYAANARVMNTAQQMWEQLQSIGR